jgi:hypothetical protein
MGLLVVTRVHLNRSVVSRHFHRSCLLHVRILVDRRLLLRVHLSHARLWRVRLLALRWVAWLVTRLVTVGLVWVAGCCVRVLLDVVPSSAPEEEAYCAEESEAAYYTAYDAADCAA